MIVSGGDDDQEAQERNGRTAKDMNHIFTETAWVFDAQQTGINTRKIADSSNFVMAESDKVLNISKRLLMQTQQNDKLFPHFISGKLYNDLSMLLLWSLGRPQVEEKSAILKERIVGDMNIPTEKWSTYRGNFGRSAYVLTRSGLTSFFENISHFFNEGRLSRLK